MLLATKRYTTNLLVPSTTFQAVGCYWTSAYFLVYTLPDGSVKLEGHLASRNTQWTVDSDASTMANSIISYVDTCPRMLAKGGTYGVGATDCHAGFGAIRIHGVMTPPDGTTDAVISYPGTSEGRGRLAED